jgi:hypothetical protein
MGLPGGKSSGFRCGGKPVTIDGIMKKAAQRKVD